MTKKIMGGAQPPITQGLMERAVAEGLATPTDAFTPEGKKQVARLLDIVERMSPEQRRWISEAAEGKQYSRKGDRGCR